MDRRSLRRVFLILLALAAMQVVIHARFLPALVASGFDMQGEPIVWELRQEFVVRQGALLALVPIVFLVAPAAIIRRWPRRLLWRGRGYWLTPEHREEAAARFDRFMVWLGLASLGLIIVLTQLVFDANRRLPPRLEASLVLRWLAAYVAFIAVWLWRVWREFRSERPY